MLMAIPPEKGPRPGATPDQGFPPPVSRPLFRLTPENFPGYKEYMERIVDLPTTREQLTALGLTTQRPLEAREKQELSGRVYLVIGTGPGSMGEAAALELAARGATVIGVTRSEAGAGFVAKIADMKALVLPKKVALRALSIKK